MAYSRITYNGKNVDIDKLPNRMSVTPVIPRTVTTSLTGVTETINVPRTDCQVRIEIPLVDDAAVRVAVENWWTWAMQGEAWTLAMDSTKTVDTTLSAAEAAGQTVLSVTSLTGITNGEVYKLCDGANYELVTVSSSGAGTVTVASAINFAYGSGATFRDRYYFVGSVRNTSAPHPIVDVGPPSDKQTWPPSRFNVVLEFSEDLT